jgi:hypothetical protein
MRTRGRRKCTGSGRRRTMSDDIRTATLLKLADHMKSINKTLTELNKEVEEMMQDIMRDLREETKGADDERL